MAGPTQVGCCPFLPRGPSFGRSGYRSLGPDDDDDGYDSEAAVPVTVLVGKERRAFLVDPCVLERDPFRALMEMTGKRFDGKGATIFVDVDSILFEHMLWLVKDNSDCPSLLQRNLREIIDFYAQDW